MRMKDVIISVTGVQQGVNGPDAMELVTAGQYGQDEKETLLTWQESELTGMEGTKTSLCVQPRSVVLSREGTLNTRMEFEEGRKRYFLYETPFGSATMGLNTRRIVNRLGAHGGEATVEDPFLRPRLGADRVAASGHAEQVDGTHAGFGGLDCSPA